MTVKVITYKEFLDLEFENRGMLILPYTDYPDDTLGIIKDSCFTPIELSEKVKAEGRLVVLPCKVGDTVYIIGGKYRAGRDETWINTGKFRLKDIEKLGKTVFLSREAAEKVLGGGEDWSSKDR